MLCGIGTEKKKKMTESKMPGKEGIMGGDLISKVRGQAVTKAFLFLTFQATNGGQQYCYLCLAAR